MRRANVIVTKAEAVTLADITRNNSSIAIDNRRLSKIQLSPTISNLFSIRQNENHDNAYWRRFLTKKITAIMMVLKPISAKHQSQPVNANR